MNTYFFYLFLTTLFPTVMAARMFKVFANDAQIVTTTPLSDPVAATGKLKYFFAKGFTKMVYFVSATTDIGDKITKIHLRCGTAGTNGEVVATLWNRESSTEEMTDKRYLVYQDVENMECEGKSINTIASLYQAIQNGSIYMSIYAWHSEAFPEEVARGQNNNNGDDSKHE